jgi:HK97 gp10 family phage protein
VAEHVHLHGLERTVRTLRELPSRLSGKNGGPVRGALFAAGRMIRDEAILRAPIGSKTPNPGNLRKQVFIFRDKNPRASTGAAERYIISVRTGRKAKARFKGSGGLRALTGGDAWYWFWVEFGTSKMKARPFMRPAFESRKRDALAVFSRDLSAGVRRLAAKVKREAGL